VKVHEALIEVMRAVPVVKKEDRNSQQNFSFRGIDSVLNAVGPALRSVGVVVLPSVQEHHAKEITTKSQAKMNAVFVLVKYTFVGPEGDILEAEVPGEAFDAGDKAFSKAMSVAFRTALLQTLALPTDEKDSDSETHERAPAANQAHVARGELLAMVRRLKLEPSDVARLYHADNGVTIQEETSAEKLRSFTERLEATK
jgi:hypothetical protein